VRTWSGIVDRRAVLGGVVAGSASLLLSRLSSAAAGGNTDHARALLDEYVRGKKVAGVVAVIGTHEAPRFVSSGHIAFSEGAAAARPDSLWRIYSMTKLVTGTAAMLVIEDGKLSLDTPVEEILPTFHSP
jgi:CubicO group peptidase (beta-lactamase class C family)